MKKTIDLYTSYKLPKEVREAICVMREDVRNGTLVQMDIRDFDWEASDNSEYAVSSRIIKDFFEKQGETGAIYIHYCW